jgi:hypothetical protein
LELDREMFEKSLSKRRDFNTKQVTEFAQKIQNTKLAPGLLGCQRESIGRTKVGQVLGKSDFSIGDVSITKFVKRKRFVDFFDLMKTESILSKEALGQDLPTQRFNFLEVLVCCPFTLNIGLLHLSMFFIRANPKCWK